jgi:hypothetical protein
MKFRPSRTVLATISLVALTAPLAACSPTNSPNTAFSVDGINYTRKDFDALTKALVETNQVNPTQGGISSSDARSVMNTLIKATAFKSMAKKMGKPLTETDRLTALDSLKKNQDFAAFPTALQNVLVDVTEVSTAMKALNTPSSSQLAAMYSKSPASTGTLCLSHIVVKTEKEALAVLADLKNGADFATEAKAKSIEPSAKTTGGSLATSESSPCSALSDLQTNFDKDFLAGAVAAKAGVPTGPVKSQFGYHIILSAKFADVSASIAKVIDADPGAHLLNGFLTQAHVYVNSIYGTWNKALASIE